MAVRQHTQSRVPLPAPVPGNGDGDSLSARQSRPLSPRLSRRTLLGAAFAVTLRDHAAATVAAPPVSPTGPRQSTTLTGEKWDRALARYRAAEAALAAVAGTDDDDLYDRHLLRFNAALKKLLRTPGPTAAALAFKLELTIEHLAWELTGGERCMAALLQDARRLAASPA